MACPVKHDGGVYGSYEYQSEEELRTVERLHDMDMSSQVLSLEIDKLVDIVAYRGDADQHLKLCARQINSFMRGEYKGFITNVGRNIYPLIIASDFEPGFEGVGSSFTLYLKDGTQHKIAPTVASNSNYEIYKALSHASLAMFVILTPHLHNPTNIMWRGKLSELKRHIEVFIDAVNSSSQPQDKKDQFLALANIYITFMNECLDAGTFTLDGFFEFTGKAFQVIKKNMAGATLAQASAILPAMLKWKKLMGPEEWSKLYVMIPTVWPVALNSPRLQLFERIMDQDKIHTNIITSEFPRNFEEARDLTGRVVGDRSVGRFVFAPHLKETKGKMKILALSSRTDVVADDFEIGLDNVIEGLSTEEAALVHPKQDKILPYPSSASASNAVCPYDPALQKMISTTSKSSPPPPKDSSTLTTLKIRNGRLMGKEGLFDITTTPCGRIASILPSDEAQGLIESAIASVCKGPNEVDADGKMILPGFVDGHIHLDKCYLLDRCCAVKGDFPEALSETLNAKKNFTVDDISSRACKLIENEISFGTTLMRAHIEVDPIIGMKAVQAILPLKSKYASSCTIQLNCFAQEGITNQPGQVELMREAMKMGCDVVGSAPYCDPNPLENINITFELAKEFNADVDFHLDYHLEGKESFLDAVIDATVSNGWQGRVCLGHMTFLSTLPLEKLKQVAVRLKDVGISILALPASDLCMMGRGDDGNKRRGVCPVHHLHGLGVCASFATNNVQNLFTFTGDGDVLKIGTLVCQALQLTSENDARLCLEMASTTSARALNVPTQTIAEGMPADLVLLQGSSAMEILAAPPIERIVIKKGKVVSKSVYKRSLFL